MRITKKVNIIGSALTIWYMPKRFRRSSQLDFFSDRHALALNTTNTALYILPSAKSVANRKETKFQLPSVTLKPIGHAIQIMWRWEKIDQTLLHKWDDQKPKIYADRQVNPRVLAIRHKRGIIFTEEGII